MTYLSDKLIIPMAVINKDNITEALISKEIDES